MTIPGQKNYTVIWAAGPPGLQNVPDSQSARLLFL